MNKKTWISIFMAAIMLTGVAIPAAAQMHPLADPNHTVHDATYVGSDDDTRGDSQERDRARADKNWTAHRDQWKKLNELEQDYLQLKIEMLKRHNEAADLYAKPGRGKDANKMKAASKQKEKMRSLHQELKEIRMQIAEQRLTAAQALKGGDEKAARKALDNWIDLKKKQNRLMKEKLRVWDKMLKKMK